MKNGIREEAKTLNIVHFKLVSGDEIIALINRNKREEPHIIIEEPLQLIHIPSTDNSYTLSFQEWLPTSETRLVTMNKGNIVAYSNCNLDTKEHYLSTIINLASPPDAITDEYEPDIEEPYNKNTTIH